MSTNTSHNKNDGTRSYTADVSDPNFHSITCRYKLITIYTNKASVQLSEPSLDAKRCERKNGYNYDRNFETVEQIHVFSMRQILLIQPTEIFTFLLSPNYLKFEELCENGCTFFIE